MNDYINRQAAIDEWKNDFRGYVNALDLPRDDYNGIMEYIDELPSTHPGTDVQEMRHGRWVDRKFEDGEWYHTCSVCGMVLRENAFDNFCGNCGASMDAEEGEAHERNY